MSRAFEQGPAPTRPEEQLVLAAAAVNHPDKRASIDRALAASPDWRRVVEWSLAHHLAPAMLQALEAADADLVPADLLAALRVYRDQQMEHNTALIAELHALLDDLGHMSVRAVSFKGPLLGELLFDDVAMRPARDLDLLVRAADVPRVCDVLEARGYINATSRPGGRRLTASQRNMHLRLECEHRFWRDSDQLVVEPHWAITPRTHAIDIDFEGMLERARPIPLGGRLVPTLLAEDLLLALSIHGAKHRWERLVWMRDIAALVAQDALDLEACVDRAKRYGCARLLLIGLGLAQRCAAAPVPPAIARLIERDRTAGALMQWSMNWLWTPMDFDAHPLYDARVDRFRFLMRERWSDRIRYVTRTTLSPSLGDVQKIALPIPLQWIYFPMRWTTPLWWLARPLVRLGRPKQPLHK